MINLLQQTRDLCKLYNIVPTKALGQNFLIDENVLNDIMLEVKKERQKYKKLNILEIGGGLGFLTNKLLDVADKVFVVEKDENLFKGLKRIEKVSNNKLIVELGDALDLFNRDERIYGKLRSFFNGEDYIVVANIPYNITSILIRKFLSEKEYYPKDLILMIQKEVGDRVCGKNNDNSVFTVVTKFYCDTNILFYVNRKPFHPSPEVDSVVISLMRNDKYINDIKKIDKNIDPEDFFKFVNAGFLNRRKMLYHNIAAVYRVGKDKIKEILIKDNLNEKIRAQDLSVSDWISLWYNIKYEK